MKRYWTKIHVKDVFSRERLKMPDWLFRRWIEFEAFAADLDNEGLLPPVADMAWELRLNDETKLSDALMALSQVGEVEETPDGWRLTQYKRRQVSESLERTRRYRDRHRDASQSEHSDGDVAGDSPLSSSLNSDSDSLERGGMGEKTKNLFSAYEQEIGVLTPLIADSIAAWAGEVPEQWIPDAIREAVKSNARSWKYAEAILKRWKAQGNQETAKVKTNGNGHHAEPRQDRQALGRKAAQNAFRK
jgi:DnaD/phage-associated family protein